MYPIRSEIAGLIIFGLVCVMSVNRCFAASAVSNMSLEGKMISGYQGWFSCPGEHPFPGWAHWKAGQAITVDMLPDMSELSPSEKCDTGLATASGEPVYVFSSHEAKTVDRHFAWMERYGLDGVALQKFSSVLSKLEMNASSDDVLDKVRKAAEHHGRVFFLMYDLSGASASSLDLVVADWVRLEANGLSRSAAYLHHRGYPLLGLWGIGFRNSKVEPDVVGHFLEKLRNAAGSFGGVTILGGVPAYWREGLKDASPDKGWQAIWPRLDVMSPWTVGRYGDLAGARRYANEVLSPDFAAAEAMGVDFMPVLFPGFSWGNLQHAHDQGGKVAFNQIPRREGSFYWEQADLAMKAGSRMLYTAMFDEVDEGTAIFKVLPRMADAPIGTQTLTLDVDGSQLPSDWFLSLAGLINYSLKSGQPLPKTPAPPPPK